MAENHSAQVDGITLGRFHEVNEAAYSSIKQARKAVISAVKAKFHRKVGKEDSAVLLHLLSQAIFENFQDFLFTPGSAWLALLHACKLFLSNSNG